MSDMSLKDWIELALLILLTITSIVRWIQRRETNDQRLGERVSTLEEGWDDKVDAGDLEALQNDVDRLRTELGKASESSHRKFGEINVAIGRCATQRDADAIRREIEQLRKRIDDHIDRKD